MTRSEIARQVQEVVGGRPEAFVDYVEALLTTAANTADDQMENWRDRAKAKSWLVLVGSLEKVRIAYGKESRTLGLRT